jgi:hypothetical protein
MDLASYFSNPFALVPLVMLIGGFINVQLVGGRKTLAQVVIFVTALALAYAGHFLGLGVFGTADLLWTGIWGTASGLSALGIASNEFIKMFLEFIKVKMPPLPSRDTQGRFN